ncbi:bifunctional helix-turn-helix domain-containing protein/methylated-DNA--[protein]-cysteine S-methyltransferase [Pedobacter hartonius]|uniref:AraC family transcriptional regulator, regulatory protein of adaptative response / methylated-DNA-[protein]-cysteine methyltransferase n=1 Tax=Pedobacter hartonius TaxID=425514 RepID=A0A1H4EPD1_9SPHI|nr:methylated-DNA--[protein]-cysteine S-methyltransferase [Pedobacter hartonius]SEA86871.1 AraC family transcriptional regulator, regulatory protein of adaptative response / methylated-DNA-[protein]-cysteine methyltransferase [Pedobacter hartonius]
MNIQEETNFSRIASAIDYINSNFKRQPGLEEVAEQVNLSPFHFQRLFTEWAGVSPKKFLQYLTLAYAKKMLKEHQATLFETAFETGLSGTGRLHDLFINIEGMTPGEYKNGGADLAISYSFTDTPFGKILVASTTKGICYIAFAEEEELALPLLKSKFPNAGYQQRADDAQQNVLDIFTQNWSQLPQVKLHLKGTAFQLKVWETLLRIPAGRLSTYGAIAANIGLSSASRAVGSAVGANPVAFLIPCHRIIQSTGVFGQYHWGSTRKQAMIGWEAAQAENKEIV